MKIIAIDLGASSGRLMLGTLDQEKRLTIKEIYRFSNGGIKLGPHLYWDLLNIFQEIKNGLKNCVQTETTEIESIGIDTWGVDFVLLDENDELIGPIHHYRDSRTVGMVKEMFKVVPREEIFAKTGIQFMELNSSTQLFSMVDQDSPKLKITETLLMLPDYFNFLLSGVKKCEFSDVTTTQLYNPIKKEWAFDLIEKFGLQKNLFKDIIPGGTILGPIRSDLASEVGLPKTTKIIAPLTHDTGSAYAAVPVNMDEHGEGEYGILSSGTWSLLGVELKVPIVNDKALLYNYTNEGGINGSIRFLKNITGLWLIQECKRIWDEQGDELSWEEIEVLAKNEQDFEYIINPDDHDFLNPQNMVDAIQNFCKKTNQDIPKSKGEIARTIFESLAFRYKEAIKSLESIIDKKIKVLHVIGGGSQNKLLNQFTANALGIPVKAGPFEATAIGNILVQAMAFGKIKDIQELRNIVSSSFEIKEFLPKDSETWDEKYSNYLKIKD